MKKRLITLIMASIMTLTLISCNEAKDGNEQSLNNNEISENITEGDNKESEKNTEANKISKDEIKKMHEDTIKRLENFYANNNLPCRTTNTYNKEVENSEHIFNSALAKQTGADMKNIVRAEYDLTPQFTVDSAIQLNWESDMVLSETIIPEYCKAVINEDVDFKNIDDIVKNYVANPENNSVSETFEVGNYDIKVSMDEIDCLTVFIKSNYEVN